ncbi:MAG TPA: DUF2125 domain-containing protein [Rhizomicrobium sp.]
MNYSHRIFLYGPVGLFAALLLATMGYWWIASDAFSKRLDALNNRDIAPGIHVSFTGKAVAGFPFRLDAELDGLRVAIATSHGPAIWTAEHFASHALIYGATHIIFEAAGKQHLEWHGDTGQLHTYDFLPGSMRASAVADAHGLSRFDFDLIDAAAADVSAARVQFHLRKDPKIDGLDVNFSAVGVHIAPELKPAFGVDARQIAFEGLISPGSTFDGLLSGHADWRGGVQEWHARDGGVLINTIAIDWGVLHASGKGALTVDSLHRPLGAVRLQITGWQKLRQSQAKVSGEGLADGFAILAAQTNPATDQLNTAVTLKDGVLFVGSTPVDLLSPLY